MHDDAASMRRGPARLLAVAASFMLIVVLLRVTTATPAMVNAALDDIVADTKHSVGLSVPLETILQTTQIKAPLDTMPLQMTKYCNLDATQALHMQIDGEHHGQVHLFVKRGNFEARFWQDTQGITREMSWQIIQPRADISVLVIRTPDMNPLNADKLVQHMFYS